jgi:WD40 repeat protein
MNVKYNSEKPKKSKKIKLFNLSNKQLTRHKSLNKINNSEKENINSINIQNNIHNKKIKLKQINLDLDFVFYKDLTNKSFADDFSSSSDNTFTVFKSINEIFYLVFASIEKSIISYDIKNSQKICEIKNAHNNYIIDFRHFYDKKNKRDLLISVSSFDNNIKIWNINRWNCILEIKNANKTGALYSASFLCENNEIYIISSNSNLLKRKDPIKIFNLKGEIIKDIKIINSINFIDCYYELNNIYIIIGTHSNVLSYDYTNNKMYNKYGQIKGSYYGIVVQYDKLIASNFGGIIEIYNFHTGEILNEVKLNIDSGFSGICLWDENNLLVGCSDKTIKLINLKERKLKKCFFGHNYFVATVKKIYIPKIGDCLISQGMTSDTIKLWKIKK